MAFKLIPGLAMQAQAAIRSMFTSYPSDVTISGILNSTGGMTTSGVFLATGGVNLFSSSVQGPIAINATAATLPLDTATHAGKFIALNRAAGIAVTLPAATGTGNVYRLGVGTAITSNTTTITRAGSDTIAGVALIGTDTTNGVLMFSSSTATVITMDGTTRAGTKGTFIELVDGGSAQWYVRMFGQGSGTEATPFS